MKEGVCDKDVCDKVVCDRCVCVYDKVVCAKKGKACHAKRRWMPATQNEGGCRQVPRLPCETKVDVAKCHVKRRWMSPSATPATQKCRGVTGGQEKVAGTHARHQAHT